ncbi:MAG: hypothetical protein AAFQ37_14295, partial [Bacteroidota bacterium]
MSKALRFLLFSLCLVLGASVSAQYTVTTGTGSFIDIAGTGTALTLADDGETNVILPFDFTFFGVASVAPIDIRVGNNGGILCKEY